MWFWCFTLTTVVTATNYYISSLGSDSNSGTNENAPWKTLNNVPMLTLAAGDKLLLHTGDVWNEQLSINNAKGNNESSVIITSYPFNTNNNITKPHIHLNNTHNQSIQVIECINCQYITFNNIEISGAPYGLIFTFTIPNAIHFNYNISNCYFHHINSYNYNASSGNWWGKALLFNAINTAQNVKLKNVFIEHNMINASDTFINNLKNPGLGDGHIVQIHGGYIISCLFTNNYYNIVVARNMYNFIIANNVFLYDSPKQLFTLGTTDLIVMGADNTLIIYNNEFGFRGEYPGGPDGCSIDFESSAVGSYVVGNYIHDSYGAGIMVFGHRNNNKTFNYNLTLNNNIFIRDGCFQKSNDHGAITFMNPSSGWIENNVFVKCMNQSIPIFWDSNNKTFLQNWVFSNNTIYNYTNGFVVDSPIVDIRKLEGYSVVTAKCATSSPQCILRYSVDGTKPGLSSMQYIIGTTLNVYVTTPILFKAFHEGLIESQTVGAIVDPFLTTHFMH